MALSRREREERTARLVCIAFAALCAAGIGWLAVVAIGAAQSGSPDAVLCCTFLSFVLFSCAFTALYCAA